MLKKLVAVVAAAVMVMAMGVTAFAAESKQEAGHLEFSDYVTDAKWAEVEDLCQAINAGTKTVADIPGCPAGAVAITKMLDVHEVGGPVTYPATATASIPNLTNEYTNVRALHYDTTAKAWEVIKADKVDYTAKTATFTFKSTSPVIIIADKAASGGKTSPATGSTTNATTFAVVAGLLALAAAGFAMRKRNA